MSTYELSERHLHPAPGKVLGLPLGNFGLFSTLLLSVASGFLAFFATCFFAIFGLLIYDRAGHHTVNMNVSYRYIAFPVGCTVLVVSFFVLLGFWVRRKISGR
jgi:hypothetical protein